MTFLRLIKEKQYHILYFTTSGLCPKNATSDCFLVLKLDGCLTTVDPELFRIQSYIFNPISVSPLKGYLSGNFCVLGERTRWMTQQTRLITTDNRLISLVLSVATSNLSISWYQLKGVCREKYQIFTKTTPLHRVYLYGCLCLDSTEHYTTLVSGTQPYTKCMTSPGLRLSVLSSSHTTVKIMNKTCYCRNLDSK